MNRCSISSYGDFALVTWLADLGRSRQSSCKLLNDPDALTHRAIVPARFENYGSFPSGLFPMQLVCALTSPRVLFIQVNKHHAMVKGRLELAMPILLNNWLIRIHSCIGIGYLKQVGKFQLNRPDWASKAISTKSQFGNY